jgi:hypothetical protein
MRMTSAITRVALVSKRGPARAGRPNDLKERKIEMTIRMRDTAPDFETDSTAGNTRLHDRIHLSDRATSGSGSCRLSASTALGLLALAVALALPAPAQPQVTTAVVTTQVGIFDRTEYTVTDGLGPLDRFKAVRLTLHGSAPRDEALLLLPPLGVNHGFYEQADVLGTPASSFAGFFAFRGYDVWQYISRMEGVPAGTCEAGIVDCSAFAGWDIQSMVNDVAFVRGLVEAANPGAKVTTGGASLGSILGFAVLNADPGRYAGAFLYEGMLFTPNAAVQALNQGHCAQGQALIAAGIVFEGAGSNIVKMLGRQADLAPAGRTPIPLFPPFLTNQQALVGFFVAPPPGPITQPVPDYFFMAGDPVAGEFQFASTKRVMTNLSRFVDYSPVPLVRDVSCALAGVDATHVANLGAFTGRVLGIGGGGGFGPYMPDNLALLTAADVEFQLEQDFGHIDHFMTPNHRDFLERPILEWLRDGS